MYTFVDIDADNNIGGEMNNNVIKWRNKNSCRCKFHLGWIVLKIEGGGGFLGSGHKSFSKVS